MHHYSNFKIKPVRLKQFIILLIFIANNAVGQNFEKKNSLTYRPMINQLVLGYERILSNKITMSIEPGFVYPLLNPYKDTGGVFGFGQGKILGFRGYNIRLNTDFGFNNKRTEFIRISIMYQDISAKKIVDHPGDDSHYYEYSQRNRDYGIQLFYNIKSDTKPWLTSFVGIGGKIRFRDLNYYTKGTWSFPTSDNRRIKNMIVFPTIHFGIRIDLIKFFNIRTTEIYR